MNNLRLLKPSRNSDKFRVKTPAGVTLEEFEKESSAREFMRETTDYVTPKVFKVRVMSGVFDSKLQKEVTIGGWLRVLARDIKTAVKDASQRQHRDPSNNGGEMLRTCPDIKWDRNMKPTESILAGRFGVDQPYHAHLFEAVKV